MNRQELISNVKNGRNVTIMLNGAKVLSAKKDYKPISHYRCATLYKLVVQDPTYGVIYFGGFSAKLGEFFDCGDNSTISLKVTVTGVGDATRRYSEPMLFAKAHLKKGDPLVIDHGVVAAPIDSELSINV